MTRSYTIRSATISASSQKQAVAIAAPATAHAGNGPIPKIRPMTELTPKESTMDEVVMIVLHPENMATALEIP